MRYGIFGDIHGNLEALEAVLADMESQGVTHPLCIGDLVGYGANPAECLEVVRAIGCPVVKGNHDDWVTHSKNPASFSEDARRALDFTRKKLNPGQMNYLRRLPYVKVGESWTLVFEGFLPATIVANGRSQKLLEIFSDMVGVEGLPLIPPLAHLGNHALSTPTEIFS